MSEIQIGTQEQTLKSNKTFFHKKKKKTNKFNKVAAISWALLYFVLIVGLCVSGTWVYFKSHFSPIYISGNSMNPTLNGGTNGKHDFGYIETSESIINSIERFDIITTFYPFEDKDYDQPYVKGSQPKEGAFHKIKRVIACPGDTFTIRDNILYFIENNAEVKAEIDFEHRKSDSNPVDFIKNKIGDENGYLTLGEDEYYVMGDNWLDSRDSYAVLGESGGGPIYKENIIGVLIMIIGTCELKTGSNGESVVTNKEYRYPTFYK